MSSHRRGPSWAPKYKVACPSPGCYWTGRRRRDRMHKHCPRCGISRPAEVAKRP